MDTTAWLDANRKTFIDISKYIWDNPEVALEEEKASQCLASALQKQGFAIDRGIGGMPTAFRARWGSGKPILGFLGEYDALPGLSQAADCRRKPVVEGGNGHGCGHNLLGTGAMAAVLALQQYMKEKRVSGTLVFYGCPAEETMTGKIRMAAAGAFRELDVALTFHPWQFNGVLAMNMQAMNTARFTFHGEPSHAAAAPELGRSALDAVELMNVGANYLREHITDDVRIHYTITNGGGQPNLVPPLAQSWYYVRAKDRAKVDSVFDRLCDIARGAALMTGTTTEIRLETGCWDMLPNRPLCELLYSCMEAIPLPEWSAKDREFAEAAMGGEAPLHEGLKPLSETDGTIPGSSDVSDVSWIVPTAQIGAAAVPMNTACHTWQFTACAGNSMGQRSMVYAAKVLALAGTRLLGDLDLIRRAKEAHEQAKNGIVYYTITPRIFS